MNDLISREALRKRMVKIQKYCEKRGYGDGAWNMPIMFVDEAPTVDAAPVVHCRDCRWGQKDDAGVMHCHKYHIHKKTDGYCDDGARMDLPEGEEEQNDG